MILLPLPIVLFLVFCFLALRSAISQRSAPFLSTLLAALAAQALINALSLHYAVAEARFFQPVTAMAVPAVAWLAWRYEGLGQSLNWRDWVHGLGPLLTFALRFEKSVLLEFIVPATYAAYAAALVLSLLRNGPDLPRARIGQIHQPRLVWGGIAVALFASALSDFGIGLLIALGHASAVPRLIDFATTVLLLGLGILAVAAQQITGNVGDEASSVPPIPSEDDHALFLRLEALMTERRLWRDPDLTITFLARRLHMPAKTLSSAVNKVTGQNISRYVNAHRIHAAKAGLAKGASVTEAMLDAGFVTKSNFNREFRRITGKAPSDFAPQNRQ